MTGAERITYRLEDGVARIALADPTRLNAINYAMAQQFSAALDRAAREARAVIMTGEGRAFCAGSAVNEMDDWPEDPLRRILNPILTRLRDFELPIVTAMNGLAVGIACSMVLCGDIIIAADNAYFLFAFGKVGLVPDGNASYLLPRLIGRARTAELMMLGERLPVAKAMEWGMVNRVVPSEQLDAEAMAVARNLAAGPASLTATKRLLWQSLDNDWPTQVEIETIAQYEAQASEDYREGVNAFMEKRAPRFTGR